MPVRPKTGQNIWMDLRYPAGKFDRPPDLSRSQLDTMIRGIEVAPRNLRAAVAHLNEDQLDTPYRPEGWTVRQVVHHIADSHMNSYMRMKLALTENNPVIKPYDQERWATLADSSEPVEPSLALIDGLHHRWVSLLRSLKDGDFTRTFVHPESGLVRLDHNIALYEWHCRHHIAHITSLRRRMGW